jgi:transcriptional regulator GlxA family with amidase domain
MKRIALLVYEDAVLSSISGPLDILNGTNRYLTGSRQPPAFEIELACEKVKNIQLTVPVQLVCHKTLDEIADPDLVLVPAFSGDPEAVLRKNRALVEWILKTYERGVEIASLCYGSYFLAEAGLLTDRSCTSHWRTVEDMQRRYPRANVLPDAVITDQEGVYTSGGAFSSLNLVLYLVEKFCGRRVCVQVSKMFSIDINRVSQAHFAVFQGQRHHDDEEILRAQAYIEENYDGPITIDEVASRTNMSRRNFVRRFKKATHNTPLEYLQRVKIEAAKKALEAGAASVTSVVYDVGYNDAKTFRSVFKRFTGLTPQTYRNRYGRA